jgi:hypothetical protein
VPGVRRFVKSHTAEEPATCPAMCPLVNPV